MKSYSIAAAADGGYYVTAADAVGTGYQYTIAFAGALTDCLSYLQNKLTPSQAAPEQAA